MRTPGPWYGKKSAGGGQGLVISEANGANVAVAYNEDDTHLLAAADEMLAALETAGDALCQTTWELRRRTPKSVNAAIDVVRAAIAKAKGDA